MRADLIGHGQPSPFAKKSEMAVPSKGHPYRILILFSIMFYYIFITTYQNIGDLFCLAIFLGFRTVCFVKISIDFFLCPIIIWTGLNIKIGQDCSKSIWVTKLVFCQNGSPIGGSFWQKRSLNTCILFELSLFWYLAQSK